MSQMLVLSNPKRRRRSAAKKRAAPRRARANPRRARRRNPIPAGLAAYMARRRTGKTISRVHRRRRRHNPVSVVRRRRNPISLGGAGKGIVAMLKSALVGGLGAIAVDLAMGQANKFLPASLQRVPGKVGAGDAVKVLVTVLLGKALSRPTRGLSMQAAQGALVVQMHQLIAGLVPSTMPLGYSVPGMVVDGNARIGPIRRSISAYMRPGVTPMLNAYQKPGSSPLLSGSRNMMSTQQREGVSTFY